MNRRASTNTISPKYNYKIYKKKWGILYNAFIEKFVLLNLNIQSRNSTSQIRKFKFHVNMLMLVSAIIFRENVDYFRQRSREMV